MEHIAEDKLEQYILSEKEIGREETTQIESHLVECSLCRETADKLQAFYRELEARLESGPTDRQRELAERLLARRKAELPSKILQLPARTEKALEVFAEIIEPYRRPMIQRFVRYVQLHPVRFASGFSLAAAALALTFFAVQPKKDTNPAYHKILHQVLYVYNKDREILWTKSARGMPDDSSKYDPNVDVGLSVQVVRVFDIDGDERNEVLITGFLGYAPTLLKPYDFTPDTLYCFNSDGNLRWKHGMSGGMRFGAIDFSKNPDWRIWKFLPVRRSSRERVQLFVLAGIMPSWASKLLELDPQTGKELQSYWHAGNISLAVEADIDGDGVKELVAAGINNHLRGATVAIFDPFHVRGGGPTIPEMFPTDAGKGTEKYYVLLPRSSFANAVSTTPYVMVAKIMVSSEGRVTVQTRETNRVDYEGGIVYGFGDNMRVNYVVADDPFEVNFEKARKQGLIKEELNAAYYENLKKSVRYWDGEMFVNTLTMNKQYMKAMKARNLP